MQLPTTEIDTSNWLSLIEDKSYSKIFDTMVGNKEIFMGTAFEKLPWHFKNKTEATKSYQKLLADIFSKSKLLDVVKEQDLGIETNIRAYKYIKGVRVSWEFKEDAITTGELETIFKKGNSAQFFQPQRFSDPLHTINAGFEHSFGSLAGASAYLTPARSQGLAPHHDDVCVFILQTEGSKLWHLWPAPMELPEHHSDDIPRAALPGAPLEVLLQCGDLLYLPRGVIHEAVSQDCFSTHVTISVYQRYNYRTLLAELLEKTLEKAAQEQVELRRGLPLRLLDTLGSYSGAGSIPPEVTTRRQLMLSAVRQLAESLAKDISLELLDSAVDALASDFTMNRLPPPAASSKVSSSVGSKRKERPTVISPAARVQLYDPHCCHFTVQDVDGILGVTLLHNRDNNRLQHMGHPAEDLDGESDEEGEDDEQGE